ncbi:MULTISPECIES: hypothetical protein [Spirulina sp. CCY15215]|uniref:hypothetical protein n=1 Tax=Spirulina sp. CCY15215 TaxID=2767591 RepID=UPI00194FAB92|nr:hypothetical protein [Spirulina major]
MRLSPLFLSGLLLISPQMVLEARSQTSGDRFLLAQSLTCDNYSPEAARQELILMSAIDQAERERSQNGFGLSNMKDMIGLISRFMPEGGRDIEKITGILEQFISFTGADIPQGSSDNNMVELVETIGDRVFSIISRSSSNMEPTEMLGMLMEIASEVQTIRARQPQSSGQEIASLNRELATLRSQCREGINSASSFPSPTSPQSSPPPQSSPSRPPVTVAANNPFMTTCEGQGGTISTYYEGERTSAESSELQYSKMVECIPGQDSLKVEILQSACSESNGTWIEPRSIPLCRF